MAKAARSPSGSTTEVRLRQRGVIDPQPMQRLFKIDMEEEVEVGTCRCFGYDGTARNESVTLVP